MANITRIKNITELIKLRETNSTDEKHKRWHEHTERLIDRQVRLDDKHWRSNNLTFFKDVTSFSVENTVDTTNRCLGTLQDTQ